jgi:Zinc knuckle
LQKGRGSTKFRSSRHTNNSRRRPGRGRWKTQRLRQVGDGAEFMEGWEARGGSSCFKCGGKGHWAKDCIASKEVDFDSGDEGDGDNNDGAKAVKPVLTPLPKFIQKGESLPPLPPPTAAALELEIDIEAVCKEESLQKHVKDIFGYTAFRGLQLVTIRKILRGESCLSIMPTGEFNYTKLCVINSFL